LLPSKRRAIKSNEYVFMGGYILVYKIKNKGSNWGYTNCFFNINIKNIPLKEYG
jgi:hypothetical protein